MTRQLSALIVATLALAPFAVDARNPTPKEAAQPPSNPVYVKIIMPADPADDEKDHPVESWIAEELKKLGQAKFAAVTGWVLVDPSPWEATDVWDGIQRGIQARYCGAHAEILDRAEGRVKVHILGWGPGFAEVTVSLADEPGGRALAGVKQHKTEAGMPYVAVFIGPPEKPAAKTAAAGGDRRVTPVLTAGAAAGEEAEESADEAKIEWGKETRGQAATLRALKTTVKSGEPIEFEIRIKNVSDKDSGLPSGRADEKMSPCFWTFYFDEWEWRSPQLQARVVFVKPGETVRVRCLVATTRDSLAAEPERRFFPAPFRHLESKKESDRLPAGTYRVRAIHGTLDDGAKTNTIEVRIIDR